MFRVNTHPPTTVKKRERLLMRPVLVWLMVLYRESVTGNASPEKERRQLHFRGSHSHSMVPGGLLVMSSTTRLTSATSLVIRVEMRSSTS